ncbi:MAG: STT3 domain-containing protein [Candidatus Nanohaloarchaea archaeon]
MDFSNYTERVNSFLTVEGLKNNWAVLAVVSVFALALWLRYLPEQGMRYLQAADPFMIYRMSQHLALSGQLPATDFLRYFPYNAPTYLLNQGNIIFPAVFYWMGPFLYFKSFFEWAQFYPALMGALGAVWMYFLGRELYDRKTGVFAALFFATIPGLMYRTSAGFFEKEPIGIMFMLLSMFLFTRAWRRESYVSGIGSGLAFGFFTISWGGSSMLWLLYPMVVGIVMLLNEDTERLMAAYVPTVIVAGGVAAALNQSRFWFTRTTFMVNMGMVSLLWSRYAVEEFELIREDRLKYYVPGMSALGGFVFAISPLFSDYLAGIMMRIMAMATQSAGAVIAGTVGENQAAGVGQLISSFGANSAVRFWGNWTGSGALTGIVNIFTNFLGPWPLALAGFAVIFTPLVIELLEKYGVIEGEVSGLEYLGALEAVFSAWIVSLMLFFNGSLIAAAAGGIGIVAVYGLVQRYANDSVFSISSIMTVFVGIGIGFALFGGMTIAITVLPIFLAFMASVGLAYYFGHLPRPRTDWEWYRLLPVLWLLTNLFGAMTKSRLLTLAAIPVAFSAGVAFSRLVEITRSIDYTRIVEDIPQRNVELFAVLAVVGVMLGVNVSAGYVAANSIGGSPGTHWIQEMQYMDEYTEDGSVLMSWWDYGYYFETLGRRPAVADGSNAGYYSEYLLNKTNYPIAKYFTSSQYYAENHTEFFGKHSVDYLTLDQSMVSKYGAVSQIAHENNSVYNVMRPVRSYKVSSSGPDSRTVKIATSWRRYVRAGGRITIGRVNYGATVEYTRQNGSWLISEAPYVQKTILTPSGRYGTKGRINCILTEDSGYKTFGVNNTVKVSKSGAFGRNTGRTDTLCLAEHPYDTLEKSTMLPENRRTRLLRRRQPFDENISMVLVPQDMARNALPVLYFTDGKGIDYAKRVNHLDRVVNGHPPGFIREKYWKAYLRDRVKLWKIDHSEIKDGPR